MRIILYRDFGYVPAESVPPDYGVWDMFIRDPKYTHELTLKVLPLRPGYAPYYDTLDGIWTKLTRHVHRPLKKYLNLKT